MSDSTTSASTMQLHADHTCSLALEQGYWVVEMPDPENSFDSSPVAWLAAISELRKLAGDPNWESFCDPDELDFIDLYMPPAEALCQSRPVVQVDLRWLCCAVRSCLPDQWRELLMAVGALSIRNHERGGSQFRAGWLLALLEGVFRLAGTRSEAAENSD